MKYLLRKEKWTTAEKERMLRYMESNELFDLEAVAAEEFNMDLDSSLNNADRKFSENVLNKIHKRIKAPKPSLLQVVRLNWLKFSVAASVGLSVGLGYLFSEKLKSLLHSMPVQHAVTAANERKSVQLPDGTLVSMEPGTVLAYPKKFGGETREVHLKGEAFFEINHDAAHPFIIHTKHIRTTVLGTSFNVEAYDSKEPSVVVVRGSVKVQSEKGKEQAVVLTSNQRVVFQRKTGELQQKEAQDDALFYRQRREGKFSYKGVMLNKVVTDLKRIYNIPITIDESVSTCIFYGYFLVGEKLDKVLDLIAVSLNATIKKDDDKGYLIVGGTCL